MRKFMLLWIVGLTVFYVVAWALPPAPVVSIQVPVATVRWCQDHCSYRGGLEAFDKNWCVCRSEILEVPF